MAGGGVPVATAQVAGRMRAAARAFSHGNIQRGAQALPQRNTCRCSANFAGGGAVQEERRASLVHGRETKELLECIQATHPIHTSAYCTGLQQTYKQHRPWVFTRRFLSTSATAPPLDDASSHRDEPFSATRRVGNGGVRRIREPARRVEAGEVARDICKLAKSEVEVCV